MQELHSPTVPYTDTGLNWSVVPDVDIHHLNASVCGRGGGEGGGGRGDVSLTATLGQGK